MAIGANGRRLLALGAVTVLFVPLSLVFVFYLLWMHPSMNGYPMCDPEWQPWCEYDPTARPRMIAGMVTASVAAACLLTAYVMPLRVRNWWMWALAAVTLMPVATLLLTSI